MNRTGWAKNLDLSSKTDSPPRILEATMMAKRPATLKEVAARVGVGPSTASVVLNGAKSGTKVSEKTREAILRVARELNYRPNVLAQSLRRQRTGIIGFFSGYDGIDPRNGHIAELLYGVQTGCASQGLDLLLYTANANHSAEQIVANLADGRLDGLLVTALPGHPIMRLLAQESLPVVAIADRVPGIASILADTESAGRLQAQHLYSRGHRQVLFVPSDFPFPSALERQTTFLEEAGRLGMRVEMGSPVAGHVPRSKLDPAVQRRDERNLELLRRPSELTALLCWDDHSAYRLASAATAAGLRVPGDVAIMGYNGDLAMTELRWQLTTIRAPWDAMGAAAVAALQSATEGNPPPESTTLPVELVVGSTT
jgi:DNA-binding LacI/PurR family transcriptional regulator